MIKATTQSQLAQGQSMFPGNSPLAIYSKYFPIWPRKKEFKKTNIRKQILSAVLWLSLYHSPLECWCFHELIDDATSWPGDFPHPRGPATCPVPGLGVLCSLGYRGGQGPPQCEKKPLGGQLGCPGHWVTGTLFKFFSPGGILQYWMHWLGETKHLEFDN